MTIPYGAALTPDLLRPLIERLTLAYKLQMGEGFEPSANAIAAQAMMVVNLPSPLTSQVIKCLLERATYAHKDGEPALEEAYRESAEMLRDVPAACVDFAAEGVEVPPMDLPQWALIFQENVAKAADVDEQTSILMACLRSHAAAVVRTYEAVAAPKLREQMANLERRLAEAQLRIYDLEDTAFEAGKGEDL